MSEVLATTPSSSTFRPSFHLWMTLLMAFFIFGGFGLTYWQPMAAGTLPTTPPIVHVHGFFYSAWIILLVLQSALVNARNTSLHRTLGSVGIALAACLLVVGTLITLLSIRFVGGSSFDNYGLTYLSVVALLSFGTLFTLAIRAVRKPAEHRNLMLFATMSILAPGINRLYMVLLDLPNVPFAAMYLTLDAMTVAIFVHDWRSLGCVSRASQIGAAIIVVPQLLFLPVVQSADIAAFSDWLASLVYYR